MERETKAWEGCVKFPDSPGVAMVVQRLGPCLYPVSCPSAEHLYMLTPEVLSGVISCEEVDQNKHVTVMSGGGQR